MFKKAGITGKFIKQYEKRLVRQGFWVFGFSDFRVFGFSGFRVFVFSRFRVFRFFWFSGFRVFVFSYFRFFGFSAFRLFGFSAFRVFGFLGFWDTGKQRWAIQCSKKLELQENIMSKKAGITGKYCKN